MNKTCCQLTRHTKIQNVIEMHMVYSQSIHKCCCRSKSQTFIFFSWRPWHFYVFENIRSMIRVKLTLKSHFSVNLLRLRNSPKTQAVRRTDKTPKRSMIQRFTSRVATSVYPSEFITKDDSINVSVLMGTAEDFWFLSYDTNHVISYIPKQRLKRFTITLLFVSSTNNL